MRGGAGKLLLALAAFRPLLGEKQHRADDVALAEDGRGDLGREGGVPLADRHGRSGGGAAVEGAALHQRAELGADGLSRELAARGPGRGDHAVPVADHGRALGGLLDALAQIGGKVRQLADGGVFFEDQLAVLLREDLQRRPVVQNIDTFAEFYYLY